MAERIEPDNFLLGVVVGLVGAVANGQKRVSVADNRAIGQPVRVPKHHAIDQHKHMKHQQKAGDGQAMWMG